MQKLCTVGVVVGLGMSVYGLTHPATVQRAGAAIPRTSSAPLATAAAATAIPAPTLDPVMVAGQQYLAAVTTYDGALAAAKASLRTLGQNAFAAAVQPVKGLLVALRAEQGQVQAIQFPAAAQADATVELQRIGANVAAADAFVAHPSAVTWKALNATFPLATTASNRLRIDLGLPTAPSV